MRDLNDMSGKKSLFVFRVNGTSKFPVNLLSSQKCFPREEEDVYNMAINNFGERSITLISHVPPSVAAWKSEGWSLVYSMMADGCSTDNEYDQYHTWPC